MHLDKDRIKDNLSNEDIHKILKDLGSKDPIQGNQYQTLCHGRNKHKLYYYDESKMFHCYTGCGENFDVYELVIRAKKQQGYTYSFPQAVHYVATLTGKTFGFSRAIENMQDDLINDWDILERYNKPTKKNLELPEYDSTVMDVFLKLPHEEWLNEDISYETQQRFNIGYYIREEKIVIPHYDINNRLVGIRGRAMKQEDIDNGRKYMPLMVANQLYNHQTMLNLYGLHKTKETIKRLKKVAIFEGEKSVLKLEDCYGDNNFSVACCSSQITNFHRDILLDLDIEEVIICFDTPKSGLTQEQIQDYQEKLLKLAKKFVPYVRTYIVYDDFGLLEEKQSPIDKGRDVLEQLMKTKYEIKTSGVEE